MAGAAAGVAGTAVPAAAAPSAQKPTTTRVSRPISRPARAYATANCSAVPRLLVANSASREQLCPALASGSPAVPWATGVNLSFSSVSSARLASRRWFARTLSLSSRRTRAGRRLNTAFAQPFRVASVVARPPAGNTSVVPAIEAGSTDVSV
ncbi:hypothetical protein BL253_35905 [Pseudofrankia asymbiotica]|uniref:Uncharacterized protein n=1 Tax=Pseudofrankia asymbiotica TaxID=1834516 RepID=A0A1V2HZW3_9ACTN|nr:hypothetical protein BL253_35905 [Pseudofrankia asymbiotica]